MSTVNTNISSINSQRHLAKNSSALGKSIERLSSGLRINKAADDAAGMAISTKFSAQVTGLNQAVRNANNAISLVQTAEGGVNTLTDILQRLRELAVQSSSDDNTASDRATLTSEANNLLAEYDRIAGTSEFNTMTLLDGSFTSKYFQVGANYSQTITFNINDARGKSVGGRAEYDADIANGVAAAVDENFGAGEIKINGYDVAATNATDDQYSVLSISSTNIGNIASTALSLETFLNFIINGTSVAVSLAGSTAITGESLATAITTAINDADIADVTARTINGGSAWVLEAANGTNVALMYSVGGAGTLSGAFSIGGIGMNDVSAMFGDSIAATVTNYNGESSAVAKAVAINAIKSSSGVLATARANVVTGAGAIQAQTLSAGDVYINGVDIGAVTVTANDGTGALVTAINNQSSSTGVTASVNSDGYLVLTAADGRNITVTTETAAKGNTSGLGLTDADATNGTWLYRSEVRLNDDDSFEIASASSVEDLTGSSGTIVSVASDVAAHNVATISINTQDDAQAAILTIDAALDDLSGIRANIGAIQNRVEFTVANLKIASENMNAAKSAITDADFALEVSVYTRNQVLTQAGTAMLGQANSTTQMSLQLLQNM